MFSGQRKKIIKHDKFTCLYLHQNISRRNQAVIFLKISLITTYLSSYTISRHYAECKQRKYHFRSQHGRFLKGGSRYLQKHASAEFHENLSNSDHNVHVHKVTWRIRESERDGQRQDVLRVEVLTAVKMSMVVLSVLLPPSSLKMEA